MTKPVSRPDGNRVESLCKYVIGPSEKFRKLPDHVSFEEATLLDTFSVCMHAIHLSGIRLNDKVAVIGAGPIGLGQLQLAKISGADVIMTDVIMTDVIMTDVVDSALELALELGADAVVNTKTAYGYQQVTDFTGGRGVDIAFECAGGSSMPVTLPQATAYTRIGGKVVIVGGFEQGQQVDLDWARIQLSEIKLIPSASYAFWGIDSEVQLCLDLVANSKLTAQKLITYRFPLDDINKAFETAKDKANTHAVFVALLI